MSEKKKGQILLFVGLIVVICVISIVVADSKKQQELVDEYYRLYEVSDSEENNTSDSSVVMNLDDDYYSIVFFGADDCSYCQLYQPVIDEIMELYDLSYYYVNSNDISENNLVDMLEKGEVSVDDFGTPTTVIIKNGEAVANNIGYMDREETFSFLQDNGLIGEDEVLPAEYENLKEITYSEYTNLINSDTSKIIVIGQTTCSACITAKPYYDKIAGEYGIDIYYLNYTKLSYDEQTALSTSLDYFVENESWATPLMLIVKNGETLASDTGFASKEEVVSFLQENNIVE